MQESNFIFTHNLQNYKYVI